MYECVLVSVHACVHVSVCVLSVCLHACVVCVWCMYMSVWCACMFGCDVYACMHANVYLQDASA